MENEQGNGNKPSPDYIPEWVVTYSRSHSLEADHLRWLRTLFPAAMARVRKMIPVF